MRFAFLPTLNIQRAASYIIRNCSASLLIPKHFPMVLMFCLSTRSQICDNRTAPIRPSQDHRVAATLVSRSHQSVSVSDPPRSEVFTLGPHPPSRHQAGQLAGEQQLRVEDLRLRIGARRGAGCDEAHDSGSGYAVLPGAGDPDGRATLLGCGGRLVGRLHFR